MDTTNNLKSSGFEHVTPEAAGEELVTVAGDVLRLAEVGLVVLLGLLVCPPLLILAAVVAVPLVAIGAVVAAVVGAVAVPYLLVRHVRAHHRAHGSTLFLHRVWRPGRAGPAAS
jgi:rRNA processing protein Gar1